MARMKKKAVEESAETRLVGYKVNFPRVAANDRDPVSKLKSVAVSNSIEVFHIPVEVDTIVAPLAYRMLRDIAFPYLPAVDEPVYETIMVEKPVVVEEAPAPTPEPEPVVTDEVVPGVTPAEEAVGDGSEISTPEPEKVEEVPETPVATPEIEVVPETTETVIEEPVHEVAKPKAHKTNK